MIMNCGAPFPGYNMICALGSPLDLEPGRWVGGGDLASAMPVCVCWKVKDMGPFLASSELNE